MSDPSEEPIGKDSSLFKMKPVKGGIEVSEDRRKTISPFNSSKHLKYAKKGISAKCDTCVYRSINAGGRGGCPKYEPGAVCAIRSDIKKLVTELDTRNPDTIRYMMDFIIKEGFEAVVLAYAQCKMDSNIPDRNTRNEIDSFVKRLQVWDQIRDDKVTVTATQASLGSKGDIENIVKMLSISKTQKDMGDKLNA